MNLYKKNAIRNKKINVAAVEAQNVALQRQLNKEDIPSEGNLAEQQNNKKSLYSKSARRNLRDTQFRVKNDEFAFKVRTEQPMEEPQQEPTLQQIEGETSLNDLLNSFQIPVEEPEFDV